MPGVASSHKSTGQIQQIFGQFVSGMHRDLVDVSDILLFLFPARGRGRGSPRRQEGAGGRFCIEKPRGGGSPRGGGGARGPGGSL